MLKLDNEKTNITDFSIGSVPMLGIRIGIVYIHLFVENYYENNINVFLS